MAPRNELAGAALLRKFALGWSVTHAADWVTYPLRVGIVRAQAAVAPATSLSGVPSNAQYRGALDAMAKVTAAEGIGALWRGYGLSLATGFAGTVMLVSYDLIKNKFMDVE